MGNVNDDLAICHYLISNMLLKRNGCPIRRSLVACKIQDYDAEYVPDSTGDGSSYYPVRLRNQQKSERQSES